MPKDIRKVIKEERERHQHTLIEHAFSLYEQGVPIEGEFTPEELQELWGGLKNLAKKGANAVGSAVKKAGNAVAQGVDNAVTKVDNFATKMNNKGMDAIAAAGQGVKNAGQAVGTAVGNVKNKVADTYNQGEVESLVQKIHSLNNQYKKLTGKSFVRQFSAVSGAMPNAQKNAAPQAAARPAAQSAMVSEALRMQKLAKLI
jgi:hypothetical protein